MYQPIAAERPPDTQPPTPDDGLPPIVRLVCAWCGILIKDGPGPLSHGICSSCSRSLEPE